MDSIGKIEDCMFRINSLVPKDVCEYFVKIFKDNTHKAFTENSYKFKDKIIKEDNFKCLNLSILEKTDSSFKKPHDLAKRFISIMITNYVLHIQKKICPSYDNSFFQTTNNIRILRYKVGENIQDHSDVSAGHRGSCTLNLNENYEGGEFILQTPMGQIAKKLEAGEIALFQIIYPHGVGNVTDGKRVNIIGWMSTNISYEQSFILYNLFQIGQAAASDTTAFTKVNLVQNYLKKEWSK